MSCYFLYQTFKYLRDVACSCTTLISLPISLFLVAHLCILIVSNANQYYVFQPLLSFCTFLLLILFFFINFLLLSLHFSLPLNSCCAYKKEKEGDYSILFSRFSSFFWSFSFIYYFLQLCFGLMSFLFLFLFLVTLF